MRLYVTWWAATCQALLSSTISWSLLKFKSIESVILSNHLILCHPLLLPSIFLSNRVFPSESALCIRWPKYCSFSFSNSPSIEESGLISFRIDWFDLVLSKGLSRVFSRLNYKKKKKKHILSCYVVINHTYLNLLYWILLNMSCNLRHTHTKLLSILFTTATQNLKQCLEHFFGALSILTELTTGLWLPVQSLSATKTTLKRSDLSSFEHSHLQSIHTILLNVMLHSQKTLPVY